MTYANITVLTEIEHRWATINLCFNWGLLLCIIILTAGFIGSSYFNKQLTQKTIS